MADAFKCDKCGDLQEGKSEYRGITSGKSYASMHLVDYSELCSDCSEKFDELIQEYFAL